MCDNPPSNYDCGYPSRVVNIVERIGVEQHEVGCLISLNCADAVEFAKKFRGVSSGCLKRLHRGEAGIY